MSGKNQYPVDRDELRADLDADTFNVEGIKFPKATIERTRSFAHPELTVRLRCPEHLRNGECPKKEDCLKVHFKTLSVLQSSGLDEEISAGNFYPNCGLLYFTTRAGTGRLCHHMEQSDRCPREANCTFLHRVKTTSAAARKKATQLLETLTLVRSSKPIGSNQPAPAGTGVAPTLLQGGPPPEAPMKKPVWNVQPNATTTTPTITSATTSTSSPTKATKQTQAKPAAPIAMANQAQHQRKSPPHTTVTQTDQPPPYAAVMEQLLADNPTTNTMSTASSMHSPLLSNGIFAAAPSHGDGTATVPTSLLPSSLFDDEVPTGNPAAAGELFADLLEHMSPAQTMSHTFGADTDPLAAGAGTAAEPTRQPATFDTVVGTPSPPTAAAAVVADDLECIITGTSFTPELFDLTPDAVHIKPADVMAALHSILKKQQTTPPCEGAYHKATAALQVGLSAVLEFLMIYCPPIGSYQCDPTHPFAKHVEELLERFLQSETAFTSSTIGLVLASGVANPRPAVTQTVYSMAWFIATMLKPQRQSFRTVMAKRIDSLTLVELQEAVKWIANTQHTFPTRVALPQPPLAELLAYAMERIAVESDYDTHCSRYCEASLEMLQKYGDRSDCDGVVSAMLRVFSRRIHGRIMPALHQAPELAALAGFAPQDSLLIAVEQATSHVALRRWAIHSCTVVETKARKAARKQYKRRAYESTPSGASEYWLTVEVDSSTTLSFSQWSPPLFIGQYVTVRDTQHAYRFILRSIGTYVIQMQLEIGRQRPTWTFGSTQIDVLVDHNEWYLNSLRSTLRHPAPQDFLRCLMHNAQFPWMYPQAPPLQMAEVTTLPVDAKQEEFINAIARKPRLAVLIGPPGTGKTHTVVSAIEMIAYARRGTVLALASSVNAANFLASELQTRQLSVLRVFSKSTSPLDVKKSTYATLLDSCNPAIDPTTRQPQTPDQFTVKSEFEPAQVKEFRNYHVVCTTTAHTQWLERALRGQSSFDYVFIDECAQATLAETLLPLTYIAPTTCFALAGDPLQLGPNVLADAATDDSAPDNLARSFMEKYVSVIERNPSIQFTMLDRCYRCHPEILSVFNRLFYNSRLRSARPPDIAPINCAFWADSLKPVVLIDTAAEEAAGHSMGGGPGLLLPTLHHSKDSSKETGISTMGAERYDNPVEADVIVAALRALVRDNGDEFAQEIGVITSFRQQVLTIRERLDREQFGEAILVGTIEQFQGHEKQVVFISMVRHTRDSLLGGSKSVGFVGNRAKTNVALSRAERMVVIVGNAAGLKKHPRRTDGKPTEPWREVVEALEAKGATLTAGEARTLCLADPSQRAYSMKPTVTAPAPASQEDFTW